ncbi:MAG: type II-A CRISPR-associated protein Csn2 [Ruminococcus sp.]|nr:type II-A CRISPR-associated protein Csn2 [Ruminococcus sp.]
MKMFTYPPVDLIADIPENKVLTIIAENPKLMYELAEDIYNQINGNSGSVVFSENYVPIKPQKAVDLITQFVPFTVNRKEILNRIYTRVNQTSINEKFYKDTQEILSHIELYLYNITEELNVETNFVRPNEITGILKAFDLKIVENEQSLVDKILEYIIACRDYRGCNWFITVGLRNYITSEEAELLFQSVLLNDVTLVCIEGSSQNKVKNETRIIIDNDLCII